MKLLPGDSCQSCSSRLQFLLAEVVHLEVNGGEKLLNLLLRRDLWNEGITSFTTGVGCMVGGRYCFKLYLFLTTQIYFNCGNKLN